MKETLYRLFEHQYLGKEEARQILQGIAQGCYNDAQIASLLRTPSILRTGATAFNAGLNKGACK